MPRVATAAADTPTLSDQSVGVSLAENHQVAQDDLIENTRRRVEDWQWQRQYLNQWVAPTPAPDCAVTFDQNMWDGTVSVTIDERAVFNEQVVHQAIAATREETGRQERREYMERQVDRATLHEVSQQVRRLTESMRSFAQAAQVAAGHMRHFQESLINFIYENRRISGWLGDSDSQTEHYEQRAYIDMRHWAEAARRWNHDMNAQHNRGYIAHPPNWGQTWGSAQQYTLTMTTANTTDATWYYPQLVNGWTNANNVRAAMGFDWGTTAATTTTAWYTDANGYVNITGGTGSGYQPTPVPCECENRGTCTHCMERARALEASRRREAKRQRQRQFASRRGRKLLLSMLDQAQLADYAKTQSFLIQDATGRTFRLRKGKTAQLLDAHGRIAASYCIHLFADRHEQDYTYYVHEDTTIAQILMLQHEPAEFDRIANITKHSQPTIDPALAQRYLEEHNRETEAILRAEGIANPREWVEELRREVRDRYVRGDDVRIQEPGQVRQAMINAVIEDEIFQADAVGEAVAA